MTKDNVIYVVHKTIYRFFDVVEDDSEEPINEKDKLLLEVNKAICNAIKDMPDEEHKGKWIDEGWYADGHSAHAFHCSLCGGHIIDYECQVYDENPHCKWCGAKMKGAE